MQLEGDLTRISLYFPYEQDVSLLVMVVFLQQSLESHFELHEVNSQTLYAPDIENEFFHHQSLLLSC